MEGPHRVIPANADYTLDFTPHKRSYRHTSARVTSQYHACVQCFQGYADHERIGSIVSPERLEAVVKITAPERPVYGHVAITLLWITDGHTAPTAPNSLLPLDSGVNWRTLYHKILPMAGYLDTSRAPDMVPPNPLTHTFIQDSTATVNPLILHQFTLDFEPGRTCYFEYDTDQYPKRGQMHLCVHVPSGAPDPLDPLQQHVPLIEVATKLYYRDH